MRNRAPRVMVVTASQSQASLILKAKSMGYVVLATDRSPDAPSLPLADVSSVVDAADRDALLRVARDFRPDAVVTEQTDVAVPAVAYVAEKLRLPGIGSQAALRATDKFAMREACRLAGIPTPRYRLATTPAAAQAAAADIGVPLVVKPTDNQASRGVTQVKEGGALSAAIEQAFAASRSRRILIEELMTGPELSIESFICGDVVRVLGVCEKSKYADAGAIDLELIYPGDYSKELLAEIQALNADVIRAVGLKMGFAHAEMMVTPQGVRLIEIAARGCGARVATDLLPRLTDIDLLAARLSQALGEEVAIPAVESRSFGILRFIDLPEGTLRRVAGLREAAAQPGVIHLEFNPRPGSRLCRPRSGDQRHGYILGIAPSRTGARALADRVTGLIDIDVV
jgi:biotin carboxylase